VMHAYSSIFQPTAHKVRMLPVSTCRMNVTVSLCIVWRNAVGGKE
jgi:hypothetical protein